MPEVYGLGFCRVLQCRRRAASGFTTGCSVESRGGQTARGGHVLRDTLRDTLIAAVLSDHGW
eukprot:5176271-Prymnesium_polylepis.1